MIPQQQRQQILAWVAEANKSGARQSKICQLLGISERTLQRWRHPHALPDDARKTRKQRPKNQLTEQQREQALEVMNSPEFSNLPPNQIVPRLAENGRYIASESTLYRLLRQKKQLQHRRACKSNVHQKPGALTATGPNQLYSWDITYLKTWLKGCYFYLYLVMDVYSRKIVGWQIHDSEKAELSAELLRDICYRQQIQPGQITLHSDNGGPMKGSTMLATLQNLGVVPSFSRPSVSNDNPYSEALFKTLKYCPQFPSKPFSDLSEARLWMIEFVQWYNHQHRHSGIGFVTPAQRHAGLDIAILEKRKATYQQAKAKYPERWSGEIRNFAHENIVYLNPDKTTQTKEEKPLKKVA